MECRTSRCTPGRCNLPGRLSLYLSIYYEELSFAARAGMKTCDVVCCWGRRTWFDAFSALLPRCMGGTVR